MRADLQTMEQIDLYLQGKLSGDALRNFETQMATDPALHTMVNDQQLLIQTVSRQALLAEINAVAGVGGTPWYANPWAGIAGVTIIAGSIGLGVYLSGDDSPEQPTENHELMVESIADDSSSVNEYTIYAENAILASDDDSVIPENDYHQTIIHKEGVIKPDVKTDDSRDAITHTGNEETVSGTNNQNHIVSNTHEEVNDSKSVSRNHLASFPKGDNALREFIGENMRFPGSAKEKELSGNVRVTFLVNTLGQRTNIEAECFNMRDKNDKPLSATQFMFNQKIAHLFEREAARIIRIMPLWEPATDSNGNAVDSAVEMYFNFSLEEGTSYYNLNKAEPEK